MDEAAAAKQYATRFSLPHHCRYISPAELLQLIDDRTAAYSEPFADYSSLPTLLLSALQKKVTVALSGDGPDELFWGYRRAVNLLSVLPVYTGGIAGKHVKPSNGQAQEPRGIHVARHWRSGNFFSYYYSSLISQALRCNRKASWKRRRRCCCFLKMPQQL